MCSCATNVNTSHPTPPQPRVTMYVAANPRGNLRDRRAGKRIFCSVYNGRNTLARASLRPTGAKNKQLTRCSIQISQFLHEIFAYFLCSVSIFGIAPGTAKTAQWAPSTNIPAHREPVLFFRPSCNFGQCFRA